MPCIMSRQDSVIAPVLPAPAPRRGRLPFFEFFRTLRENMVATYGEEAYERDIVERTMFGRHRFLVNEPAAIKHVLLDNAANYQKTEITRRILEPGLGKGLITTEGETWRQHRRTMSPSFDHRSIASYAPVITGAAQQLLADWDRLEADNSGGGRHGDDGGDARHHLPHDVLFGFRPHGRHHGAQRRTLSGANAA